MTAEADELRVLVWAPRGRDATLAAQLLERNGFVAVACSSAAEVAESVASAGCALLTEEALLPEARRVLTTALAQQPAWSDFPVIVSAPRASGSVSDALSAARVLGNVTVLERPVQSRTLVSAVVAALRGRRRQYEARGAIHRRDEFLAMLGHELRNPLAAMSLAIDALHRDCGELSARPRAILDRQTRHLARLVDDLLDVARVTTGKVTLHPAPIELHDVIARCIQNAEVFAGPRGTQIRLTRPATPAIVDGDADRLEEVFSNLLSNAIKYSPEGSVVELASRVESRHVVVDVIDQGVGIAEDMLPRVFDLFAQAEGSLDRSQGGLGVGLTVVKSVVELHRGTVTASSKGLGKGSSFRVELPLAEVPDATADATTDGLEIPPGLRVLIVEDNPDLLEVTSDLLVELGCEVTTAIDGPSGLAQLSRDRFALALIDIGLPGLDGYELVRRARLLVDRQIRLVAMSGYGQAEDRARALAAGCDLHLTKPVSVADLRRVLAETAELSSRGARL